MKKIIFMISVMLALTFACVYAVVRTVLFFYLEYSPVERVLGALLLSGELFILLHSLGYILSFLRIRNKKEPVIPMPPDSQPLPLVAVLVAARHEPYAVLEKTFLTLKNLNYPSKHIYFLDDSSEDSFKKEAEELAKDLDLILFRRSIRQGAKAGIINDCLKNLNEKYIALFDADQQPMPDFLNSLVALMEIHPDYGFIQTPQFYTNIESNAVARAAAFQQAIFYEYLCEGKSAGDSMFCCGTNVLFRAKALKDVGGFDESTVTEDFATSVKFHERGWKSLYYPHVSAFGMGPEDLGAYFKQQFRWATGTITVFKRVVLKFFFKPFSLSFIQWWEYLLSSTYYFIGLAYLFLILCPIIYLLFEVPSFFAMPQIYILSYIPYMFFAITIFYLLLQNRHYRIKDLFLGQVLGICSFPVYIQGALSALAGVKTTFGITAKGGATKLSYLRLWPQILMLLLCESAIVWGINRFIYEKNPAILVNIFWTFYHFVLLTGIFYFNEAKHE